MPRSGKMLKILLGVLGFLLLAGFLFPILVPHGQPSRKVECQWNLQELARAFQMYVREYDSMLPSSAACGSSDAVFRTTLGQIPPGNGANKTILELLYPYNKNKGDYGYRCPSDSTYSYPIKPSDLSSYVLKKAINDAWLDRRVMARREQDYKWPGRQILFYERESFHWGGGELHEPGRPGKDAYNFNCVFMDGHVKTHQITQFEPDYYNVNGNTGAAVKKPQINPRLYCDRLQ